MNFKIPWKILTDERELTWSEIFNLYFTMFIAEFIGTGLLLFFGCAALIKSAYPGEYSGIQAAALWGGSVGVIVVFIGPISGSHINPAVTISFYIWGKLSLPLSIVYILGQSLGAAAGFGILLLVIPESIWSSEEVHGMPFCTCAANPEIHILHAFFIEVFSSSLLGLVVCGVLLPRSPPFHDTGSFALKFAIIVFILGMTTAPYSGASLNPARAFGPALILNGWKDFWVAGLAPLVGSGLITLIYVILFNPKEEKNN